MEASRPASVRYLLTANRPRFDPCSEFDAEREEVKKLIVASVLLATLCVPALADRDDGNRWGDGGGRNHGVHGAPGPIAGAGLPILAVGYGVYRLIRRRRKAQ